MDGRAETAEVHAAFAQLDEHTLHVIRPGRGGIMFQFADPECLPLRKGSGDEFDFAVGARHRRDANVSVHRDRQDQAFVVIRMIAEHLQPGRRLDSLDALIALLNETGGGLGLFTPEEGEEHPVLEVFDENEQED